MAHNKWTKFVPSECKEDGRWAIRSMLWIWNEMGAEQVPVAMPDVTAALISLSDRQVLVVSVCVEGVNMKAWADAGNLLRKAITETIQRVGQAVDVVMAG